MNTAFFLGGKQQMLGTERCTRIESLRSIMNYDIFSMRQEFMDIYRETKRNAASEEMASNSENAKKLHKDLT